MTDDPRLAVARRWSGGLCPEEAEAFLAELDGVDPLRRPVSQDRVEAAATALFRNLCSTRVGDKTPKWAKTLIRAALAAADRVQAVPTTDRDLAWNTLVCAAIQWAQHMDQWDKFQFDTEYGPVYVRIALEDQYPDTYDRVPPDFQGPMIAAKPAEKPDFPPWSDSLGRLRAAGWRVGVHNDYRLNGAFYTFWLMTDGGSRYLQAEGRTDAEALALIVRRAFPETSDAG